MIMQKRIGIEVIGSFGHGLFRILERNRPDYKRKIGEKPVQRTPKFQNVIRTVFQALTLA